MLWKSTAAAVLAVTAFPLAGIAVGVPSAAADVCGSVGARHVSVGGCASLADAIADYVPPPSYYAPMPDDEPPPDYIAPPPPPPPPAPNVSVCANVGRRISVSGCV